MTGADAAAAIREHVRAFNERDVDALMNGFTDDASWITGTSAVRGRADLTELFTSAMAGLLPTLTIQNLLATPDRAACQLTERLTVHGEEQVCSIAGFYEFRDGRIAAAKIYREGNAEVELPRLCADQDDSHRWARGKVVCWPRPGSLLGSFCRTGSALPRVG